MAQRIGLKTLAEVCRRTATSHAAGLDARRIWKRESETGSPVQRREFLKVSQAVNQGSSLSEALARTGDYVPSLVHDMVHVGEQTGKVDEALNRLGEYYEQLRVLRGAFLAGIAWPVFQLIIAVFLIGGVIWIMGFLPGDYDMVGLGLSGTRGALIYFVFVTAIALGLYFFLRSLFRGKLSAPFMDFLMRLPVVGRWLQLMAMSRMTWSLGLAVGSSMNAKDCARVALRSTQNRYFTQHSAAIEGQIGKGESMYEAFKFAGVFSQDFLDAVQTGEEAGRLAESMEVLSRQYEQQGKTAMRAAAAAGGVGVWMLVAAAIIFFIFRFAMFYAGLLEDAINF